MIYYAVAKGHNIGIYNFWNDCKEQVIGFKGAIFKSFKNEKDAEDFILNINTTNNDLYKNIYYKFDDENVDYFVYTDGSCQKYKSENIISIGIYFNQNNINNTAKVIDISNINKTNNTAELLAIINAYNIIKNDLYEKKICIVSDSEYAIKCATNYGDKCYKNNWDKDIPNKLLVKEIYNIHKNNDNLKFKHIKAHTINNDKHSIGNRNADKLAYNAIKNYIENLKT
jgi:ribonuclease HI